MRWIVLLLVPLAGCVEPQAAEPSACDAGFCLDPVQDGVWHSPGYFLDHGPPHRGILGDSSGIPVDDVLIQDATLFWSSQLGLFEVNLETGVTTTWHDHRSDWRFVAEPELRWEEALYYRDAYDGRWRDAQTLMPLEQPPGGDWLQLVGDQDWGRLVHWDGGIESPLTDDTLFPIGARVPEGLVWTSWQPEQGGRGTVAFWHQQDGAPTLFFEDWFHPWNMLGGDGAIAYWGSSCPPRAHCHSSIPDPVRWIGLDGEPIQGRVENGTYYGVGDLRFAAYVDQFHLVGGEHIRASDGSTGMLTHPVDGTDVHGVAWGIDDQARLWFIDHEDFLAEVQIG